MKIVDNFLNREYFDKIHDKIIYEIPCYDASRRIQASNR